MAVMLHHAVRVDAQPRLTVGFGLQVREDVHARGVPPHEEWLAILVRLVDEVQRLLHHLIVDRLHALACQRPGVLCSSVGVTVNHAAWPELLHERGIARIVGVLRLLAGIQVIQRSKELVETMRGWKHRVAVTEVVLAELPRCVAACLQQRCDGWILGPHSLRGTRQADLCQTGSNR